MQMRLFVIKAHNGESWVRGAWWNKRFITPRSPATPKRSAPQKRSQSSPPGSRPSENIERNPDAVDRRAESPEDVFVVPSTPTRGRVNAITSSPTTARLYNPSIRGTPGGMGRSPASTGPSILRSLLWPNVPAGRLLGLRAADAWERLRREHNVETTAAEHAAARARQNHFCVQDGQDVPRNAGGFDPDSYETNDGCRKRYCALAYDDLRRAAIALDRVTDSQTWVISFRPEAHPDNVVAADRDATAHRVRDPLRLAIPLFHVPAALQARGNTLPEWRAEVQGLKNHMRRTFAAPHVETYPLRRKAAGLSGTLTGASGLQIGGGMEAAPNLPARVRSLGLDDPVAEQVLQILEQMPIEEAFAALVIAHHIPYRDAIDLLEAKLDDDELGL